MHDLVPSKNSLLANIEYPSLVEQAGSSAKFAWDEFFVGQIRNSHTRKAYKRAVTQFLNWVCPIEPELSRITPGMVGNYFEQLELSIPSKKVHMAGIRQFFDCLVLRHVVILNPAGSVRTERYSASEGKTPMISAFEARKLLAKIDHRVVSGLRDRALIGILMYTAARAGAVAKLNMDDYTVEGNQKVLHFHEKGGKCRKIPVRHDVEQWLDAYVNVVGVMHSGVSGKRTPLFRTILGKKLTERSLTGVDICRLVKRRLKSAGLSNRISPHSFRALAATDLLEQGVSIDDVQYLLGHSDSRTTKLYDRRQHQVTRNIVERISI